MISSKILPENYYFEALDSILQIVYRFLRNGVQQEFESNSFKMSVWWKAPKKLGECEDLEACDSTLQILVFFLVLTGFSEISTVRAPNWRSDDKQEKQAKKDYYEASDSLLQIGHLLSSNRVQQEFTYTSSKIWLWWKAPKNKVKTKIQRRVKIFCKSPIF